MAKNFVLIQVLRIVIGGSFHLPFTNLDLINHSGSLLLVPLPLGRIWDLSLLECLKLLVIANAWPYPLWVLRIFEDLVDDGHFIALVVGP